MPQISSATNAACNTNSECHIFGIMLTATNNGRGWHSQVFGQGPRTGASAENVSPPITGLQSGQWWAFTVGKKIKWSKGGIQPSFVVKRGCRLNAAAGGAPTCPKLPQIQFWRSSKVPTALAEHAHLFFLFFEHGVGANGTAAHEGSYESLLTTWGG